MNLSLWCQTILYRCIRVAKGYFHQWVAVTLSSMTILFSSVSCTPCGSTAYWFHCYDNVTLFHYLTINILQSVEPSLFDPPFILYQSPSADTHYIISARDFENRVNYFLTTGTSYQIQVSSFELILMVMVVIIWSTFEYTHGSLCIIIDIIINSCMTDDNAFYVLHCNRLSLLHSWC